MNETILITGGCGFAGSTLAINLKGEYSNTKIIAFDNFKRRGSELNIRQLKEAGIEFVHGDISNREDFNSIGEISVLIKAAAEPSVLSGIQSSPNYVFNTNLLGTVNCLELARKHSARFVFLSTSRFYPIKALKELAYTEKDSRFEISPYESTPSFMDLRTHGVSKLKIKEMGSPYFFILMNCFIEKLFSRGDFQKKIVYGDTF